MWVTCSHVPHCFVLIETQTRFRTNWHESEVQRLPHRSLSTARSLNPKNPKNWMCELPKRCVSGNLLINDFFSSRKMNFRCHRIGGERAESVPRDLLKHVVSVCPHIAKKGRGYSRFHLVVHTWSNLYRVIKTFSLPWLTVKFSVSWWQVRPSDYPKLNHYFSYAKKALFEVVMAIIATQQSLGGRFHAQ